MRKTDLNMVEVCLTLNLLVVTFVVAISLDHDQARQNVGPDHDPNCFIL